MLCSIGRSYSNVVATLALFFALTGVAGAGATLWVTGANVRDHSLTGDDIRQGSLSLEALSPAARAGLRGPRGLRGVAGPQGSMGEPGTTGSQGPGGSPGPAGAQGAQGPVGATGPAGAGVTTGTTTGAGVTGYQDFSVLASYPIATPGDYVVFTTLTVANTGANAEYLNCGYRLNGQLNGAAGAETQAGGTTTATSVGAFSASAPGTVEFLCVGNGGTTYDISGITMRVHNLG